MQGLNLAYENAQAASNDVVHFYGCSDCAGSCGNTCSGNCSGGDWGNC